MLTTNIGGDLGVLALLLCMTLFLISYNTDLVLLVVIPAMKNVSAAAGLMKIATLPEINMEYWVEYRDLILVKWVPDRHPQGKVNENSLECFWLSAAGLNTNNQPTPKNSVQEQKGHTIHFIQATDERPPCPSAILLSHQGQPEGPTPDP
ncbi:hypothetical protein DSO57_1001477 [Entomophthora muscae]|uniref:Uncharacterized protein n=1 Tax=Entomophthora muscae TaxID=34485 RepID=A0ACC2UJ75_9FUNG|nr:hypothetical protein DSO57_1001477 [Entomophthora muscae]